MPDESYDLQKMQNGILSIASTILLCIWFINFQLGITTDFRQMKTYLKENYPTVKQKPKTLWTTLIITKVIYVSIWIVLPIVIGIAWWKVLIGFFIMHYTAGLILSIVFQLAHVVEETDNPFQTN
jgi:linoleoyl-CoA desaturase